MDIIPFIVARESVELYFKSQCFFSDKLVVYNNIVMQSKLYYIIPFYIAHAHAFSFIELFFSIFH